jgi:hypothetical protein
MLSQIRSCYNIRSGNYRNSHATETAQAATEPVLLFVGALQTAKETVLLQEQLRQLHFCPAIGTDLATKEMVLL